MVRRPSSLKEEVPEQGMEYPLQYQDSIVLSFLQKAEFREIPACNCRQALVLKGTKIQDGTRTRQGQRQQVEMGFSYRI